MFYIIYQICLSLVAGHQTHCVCAENLQFTICYLYIPPPPKKKNHDEYALNAGSKTSWTNSSRPSSVTTRTNTTCSKTTRPDSAWS